MIFGRRHYEKGKKDMYYVKMFRAGQKGIGCSNFSLVLEMYSKLRDVTGE
jgi:hypothetical protein